MNTRPSSVVPDLSAWIRAGDTVAWGQSVAEPLTLTHALVAQRHDLGRLRLFPGLGAAGTLRPEHADAFDVVSYAGGGHRELLDAGMVDLLPVHYSDLPRLVRSGVLRVDVVLVQVSAPDAGGRHSLGLAAEYLLPMIEHCRMLIGEVHPDLPWTYGERSFAATDFDLLVDAAHPLLEPPAARSGEAETLIAAQVAGLIEDGSTLQLGIGSIPDATLAGLLGHRHLGLHTGAAGDGVAALAEAGVLTHERKTVDRGLAVAGLLVGGAAVRRWAHRNPSLCMRSTEYTHSADVLTGMARFVSINSAIEVDLTGQVNSEVAAGRHVGAVGGTLDFARAAARSRGGLPITALPATAGTRSRIVDVLSGPVTLPRSDAGLIVTEHGVADLRGLTLSQRVAQMIDIAAPAHRAHLAAAAEPLLRRLHG